MSFLSNFIMKNLEIIFYLLRFYLALCQMQVYWDFFPQSSMDIYPFNFFQYITETVILYFYSPRNLIIYNILTQVAIIQLLEYLVIFLAGMLNETYLLNNP